MEGYHKFVEEKWKSFNIQGWGECILEEKFKVIKHHIMNLAQEAYCKYDLKN